METAKKGEFIELDYTGKFEDGTVFDTTLESVAKENNLDDENHSYKPLIICIGKGHLLKGLDDSISEKEIGKTYNIKLSPEQGFGKKSAKLIQLISTSKFRKDNIQPMPGMQVNVDGIIGIVKTVTGGRTIVDFNHPLSGRNLDYEVLIRRIIEDDSEKLAALISLIGLAAESKVENGNAEITAEQELPEEFKKKFSEDIKDAMPSIKEVSFKIKSTAQ